MAVRFVGLRVARDPQVATILEDAPVWVVPVLEEVFGQGNVQETGETSIRRYPMDAGAEYKRLEDVYGGIGNPKVSFVEKVYGAGSRGVNELRKAMQDAVVADAQAIAADPLLA